MMNNLVNLGQVHTGHFSEKIINLAIIKTTQEVRNENIEIQNTSLN